VAPVAGDIDGRGVAVKVDGTPPETVAFEATDPADPRRVSVIVADRTSGVASGRIELRRAGGVWKPVATRIEHDRLVAQLDDAALRAGAYELRALVADVAGNETVGTRRVDGAPATLRLPLRRRSSSACAGGRAGMPCAHGGPWSSRGELTGQPSRPCAPSAACGPTARDASRCGSPPARRVACGSSSPATPFSSRPSGPQTSGRPPACA
jgi:hypothetical protein